MPTVEDAVPGLSEGVELLRDLRPYVRQCGDCRRPAWHIANRRLLDFLVVFIEEGTGTFSVGGQTWRAEPGDLFWIPPDTDHEMRGDPPSMVCPYVHFDLDYRPPVCHWDFPVPGGMTDLSELAPLRHPPVRDGRLANLCGRLQGFTNRRVGHLIREICAEMARAQPFAALRASALLLEALTEILRGQLRSVETSSSHVPGLEAAADYILRHCEDPLRERELARLAGLGESRFRQLFGQHFGRSPREYLRWCRIVRARQLMVGTDLTLSEIAVRTGFATVHSFSRAFRAVEGVAPSSYRRFGSAAIKVEGRRARYAGAQG